MQDPLSVACPTCLAKIGEKCRKPSGVTKPHASRIAAEAAATEAEFTALTIVVEPRPTVLHFRHTRHTIESIDGQHRVISPNGHVGPWTKGNHAAAWRAYKAMRQAQAQAQVA